MLKDIKIVSDVITSSIKWADDYDKGTFPREELKEFRRKLRRFADSLSVNCSIAAYGESQVGKSYLMSSLLSTPEKPFVIVNKGKNYSFIDDLNPSGGNLAQTESTGVVTRFTLKDCDGKMKDYVKIKNLSVADLIMLITDSYYNDLKIDVSRALRYDMINEQIKELSKLWANKSFVQHYLTEDDVKDICDYIKESTGSGAMGILQSDFRKIIPEVIGHIKPEDWVKVFCLLWNQNEELSRLFSMLISEYHKLDFRTVVYVPFDAVMRVNGTLLKIEWLDGIFGNVNVGEKEICHTDVYDSNNHLIAAKFSKSVLSALIAELTFVLPKEIAKDRQFLEKVDLLDFPGARSREKFKEQEITSVLPTILRRGKVAYLFNKYSRSLNISGVLFCHHQNQKSEATLGETINSWIESNIGRTPAERADNLTATNGISPLFFIATKFNIELEKTKQDNPSNPALLNEHWKRFKTVYPEIIKPATWLEKWVSRGGIFSAEAFQSIYLLRDFYWSGKNRVFDGYSDGAVKSPETAVHHHADFPDYFDRLRESFIENDFVRTHFRNPIEAWASVASVNRDGSKEIIRDLNAISNVISDARRQRYQREITSITSDILNKLNVYYEPEDVEKNNARVRTIIRDIRLSLDSNVGAHPETFGRIIDQLMIPTSDLRRIVYDIALLRTETPEVSDEIIMIRAMAGIESMDCRQVALEKLCSYYLCSEDELSAILSQQGLELESIVTGNSDVATTVADIISNKILDYWVLYINQQTSKLEQLIPHSDEIAFMLQTLCLKLGVKKKLSDKINVYTNIFQEEDLPNAVADFASLTLNNFVSSVGKEYMTEESRKNIEAKAATAGVQIVNQSNQASTERKDVVSALMAFDDAQDLGIVPIKTLMKLPFWNNFQGWKSNLMCGILYVSDISHADPKANKAIKEIIEECQTVSCG